MHDAALKKSLKGLLAAQGFDAKQIAAIRGLDGIDADFTVYADRFLVPGAADEVTVRPGTGYVRTEERTPRARNSRISITSRLAAITSCWSASPRTRNSGVRQSSFAPERGVVPLFERGRPCSNHRLRQSGLSEPAVADHADLSRGKAGVLVARRDGAGAAASYPVADMLMCSVEDVGSGRDLVAARARL